MSSSHIEIYRTTLWIQLGLREASIKRVEKETRKEIAILDALIRQ
jgi:hypothetical protein